MGQRETEGRIETSSSSNLVLDVFERDISTGASMMVVEQLMPMRDPSTPMKDSSMSMRDSSMMKDSKMPIRSNVYYDSQLGAGFT